MEDVIKFVFYAIIFVVYVVSQIRKAKNKKAEEEAQRTELDPSPVVEHRPRTVSEKEPVKPFQQDEGSGYRTERVNKPLLKAKVVDVPKVQVEYKTLDMVEADEALKIKKVLAERKVEQSTLLKDRIGEKDEHLAPYVLTVAKEKKNPVKWLKNKSALKQAFIASEIFKRKY